MESPAAASAFSGDAESPAQVLKVTSSADDDYSPSSAKSSFRELDDVFLQTQARIWLGEVLRTRLNEQLNIADLLADGELLFELAKEVWEMMSTKRMELRGVEVHKFERFVSRMSSGKYRPYSNVDSFLKVCKILGLAGIDLFSPSDVVEKRNTRNVCMCIRSLSKNARCKHLNVPDFDIVTYTVAMPTNMVGGIRRSWEQSHCSPSSSVSDGQHHKFRPRSKQQHSNAASGRSYDWYSEESDEIESFMLQSDSSTTSCSYNSSSHIYAELVDSPEISSMVENCPFERCSIHSDVEKQQKDGSAECCWEEGDKSMRYLYSQHLDYDYQQDSEPSPSFVDLNLEDSASVVGSDDDTLTGNHIEDQSCSDDATLTDGEDGTIFVCGNTGPCISKATRRNLENEFRSRYSDDDNVEVSSIASMSSTIGAVQKSGFDDQLDEEEYFRNEWFPESPNNKIDLVGEKPLEGTKHQEVIAREAAGHGLTNVNEGESLVDMKVMHIGFSSRNFGPYDAQYTDRFNNDGILLSQVDSNSVDDEVKEVLPSHPCFSFHQWDQKGKCGIAMPQIGNEDNVASFLSFSQGVGENPDNDKQEKLQKVENSDGSKDARVGKSDHGKQRRLIINSLVSGTAVLGTLLLFLHLRKNVGEKTDNPDGQWGRIRKANNANLESQKERKGKRTVEVYPAEKLKFGN